MNEFLSAFGVDPSTATNQTDTSTNATADDQTQTQTSQGVEDQTSSTANPNADNQTQTSDNQTQTTQTDDQTQNNQTQQTQTQPDNKQAQAFAAMRVQNKQMQELLKGVAEVLGVDASNPEALTNVLKEKIVNAQAQKQGVDPALLKRLNDLEERDRANEEEAIKREAYLGFQRVKEQFKLEQTDLEGFASQLMSEGINPFESRMNLVSAYIERNFDKMLAAAEERGAQREAQRATNASQHSSTPNNKNGQTAGDPEKITSVQQLEDFLKGAGK